MVSHGAHLRFKFFCFWRRVGLRPRRLRIVFFLEIRFLGRLRPPVWLLFSSPSPDSLEEEFERLDFLAAPPLYLEFCFCEFRLFKFAFVFVFILAFVLNTFESGVISS